MKITYLNPENVPLEKVPEGWMLKTELHPVKEGSYKTWTSGGGFITYEDGLPESLGSGKCDHWTYITQLTLPPEYLFDFDGNGLSFDDSNYRAAVKKAHDDGQDVEGNSNSNPDTGGWVSNKIIGLGEIDWSLLRWRIHPKHAA